MDDAALSFVWIFSYFLITAILATIWWVDRHARWSLFWSASYAAFGAALLAVEAGLGGPLPILYAILSGVSLATLAGGVMLLAYGTLGRWRLAAMTFGFAVLQIVICALWPAQAASLVAEFVAIVSCGISLLGALILWRTGDVFCRVIGVVLLGRFLFRILSGALLFGGHMAASAYSSLFANLATGLVLLAAAMTDYGRRIKSGQRDLLDANETLSDLAVMLERQSEDYKRARDDAESANRAKSEFLANMSHELRTPLNAIIGFSEMARDAVMGPLDAHYREYAGDVAKAGQHLQTIINDILDISKIEDHRLELRDDMVSIAETADACARIVATMAESADVAVSVAIPHGLPLLRADEIRMKQILLNLMSNAVKFTPPGGSVTVSAAAERDGVVISVEDNGIGMNVADIQIALQPFRQIDGTLSRRFEGTGLGLPLAKALVELHGGQLDIESAPALGTTVLVRFPADRMLEPDSFVRRFAQETA